MLRVSLVVRIGDVLGGRPHLKLRVDEGVLGDFQCRRLRLDILDFLPERQAFECCQFLPGLVRVAGMVAGGTKAINEMLIMGQGTFYKCLVRTIELLDSLSSSSSEKGMVESDSHPCVHPLPFPGRSSFAASSRMSDSLRCRIFKSSWFSNRLRVSASCPRSCSSCPASSWASKSSLGVLRRHHPSWFPWNNACLFGYLSWGPVLSNRLQTEMIVFSYRHPGEISLSQFAGWPVSLCKPVRNCQKTKPQAVSLKGCRVLMSRY